MKKYKIAYIMLFILVIINVFYITYLNIFMYKSIVKYHLSTLPLFLIIPLYIAFKNGRYYKKPLIIYMILLILIFCLDYVLLPKYSYKEAVDIVNKDIKGEVLDFKKAYTDDERFIYKGNYIIKIKKDNDIKSIIFDIQSGGYDEF